MSRVNAKKASFEAVTVLDHPMLFTCLRVDRNSIPDGLYMYEVRHDDDMQGLPIQIAEWIIVNHWGTLISDLPIALEPNINRNNAYRDIDPEHDWNYEGHNMTLEEYMERSPVVGSMPKSDVYRNCDKVMMIDTNMGAIPLEDFREIKAQQYGFESYDKFFAAGYRLGKDIDKRDNLKTRSNPER